MMLFPGSAVAKPKGKAGKPSREALARGRALRYDHLTSESIRDIGPPPPIVNPRRRKKAIADLEYFLKAYFPRTFTFPFSDDHRRMISVLQRVATVGGLSAFAMPRGQGKTQIVLRAAIWAVLSGHRRHPCMIGATQSAARDLLQAVSVEISSNEALYGDFPRELHGLPQLQEDNRTALKQLSEGQPTHPRIGSDQLIFPTIAGSICAGARITTCGITGKIRGQFHTQRGGGTIRPDLVIPDDPQTSKSAGSAMQTAKRLAILRGDILGLAGPGVKIACAMPCTVIQKDDMADQILRDPAWQAVRTKTLYSFPVNLKLWDEYFAIHAESLRIDGSAKRANQFYRDHRAEMDEGAKVAWEHRKDAGDLSALQTAMHKWHEGPAEFAAECQNEPIDVNDSADAPTFATLTHKLTRLARGLVPQWAHWLTVGIDVQKRFLAYLVLASAPGFTSSIVEYGAWPQQNRAYWTRSDAWPTLESVSGSAQQSGYLWRGLQDLSDYLCGRTWTHDGRGVIPVSRALIDASDGNVTELIFNFCRQSKYPSVLMPYKGKGIKAGDRPMSQYKIQTGETLRQDCIVKLPENYRSVQHVIVDTNTWKTFMADRAKALEGETGSLTLHGDRPEQHQMLSHHLAAERPTKTFGRGRSLWEWKETPNTENEFLDCLVMAGVAAHLAGANLENMPTQPQRKRRRGIKANYVNI